VTLAARVPEKKVKGRKGRWAMEGRGRGKERRVKLQTQVSKAVSISRGQRERPSIMKVDRAEGGKSLSRKRMGVGRQEPST